MSIERETLRVHASVVNTLIRRWAIKADLTNERTKKYIIRRANEIIEGLSDEEIIDIAAGRADLTGDSVHGLKLQRK